MAHQPLLTRAQFLTRLSRAFCWATIILFVTVGAGALFYHFIDGDSWMDAALNAVMIMTGLGLAENLHTEEAKFFTCFYAISSTVVFFLVLGIIFSPIVHRFLHRFHLDIEKD